MEVVLDTNVLVSYLLLTHSVPGQVVRLALDRHTVLASQATLDELASVLARPKFDRYVTPEARQHFLSEFSAIVQLTEITQTTDASADPDDNHYLNVAINGAADCIVTGDNHLLILHPFEGIPILAPSDAFEFLAS